MNKFASTLLLLTATFIWNEGRTQELSGTTWVNSNFDNCTSKIEFLDEKTFQHFYCGIEETNNGTYSIVGDTLILNEFEISEVPVSLGGSDQPYLRFSYIMVLNGSTLEMVKFSDIKYNTNQNITNPEHHYILKD